MSDFDLAALKALYAAATPGEWHVHQISETSFGWRVGAYEIMKGIGQVSSLVSDSSDEHDAKLIVELHNAFPALVQRIEALERELETAKALLDKAEHAYYDESRTHEGVMMKIRRFLGRTD